MRTRGRRLAAAMAIGCAMFGPASCTAPERAGTAALCPGASAPFEGGLSIRQLPVETAFARKVRILHVVDGVRFTDWRPGTLTYQLFVGGDEGLQDVAGEEEGLGGAGDGLPLYFRFPREESWNAVQWEGKSLPARADVFACDPEYRRLAAGGSIGEAEVARLGSVRPLRGSVAELRVFGENKRNPRFRLSEVRFLRIEPGVPGAPDGGNVLTLSKDASGLGAVLPFPPSDLGIDSVSLALRMERPFRGDLRVSIEDPAHACRIVRQGNAEVHPREHFAADVSVGTAAASPWVSFELDIEDFLASASRPLVLKIASPSGAPPVAEARVRLRTRPAREAAVEHDRAILRYAALRFSHLAEMWTWNDDLRARFVEILENEPNHRAARAYLDRIDEQRALAAKKTPGKRRAADPGPPASFDASPYLPLPATAPGWARWQIAMLRESQKTVHWYIDNLQMEDGQMGGGWNDDVEASYQWPYLWLIAGDEKVRGSMRKIADGIWDSGRIKDGYCRATWDVEHACEDTTCSQPPMLLLDYGDPRYVERCLQTAGLLAGWTRVNKNGHRHFKSFHFQAKAVDETPPFDVDLPYNVYTLPPSHALVWWNGQPESRRLMAEIGRAWVEDMAKSGEPSGDPKPKWAVPREIGPRDCSIGPYSGTWKTAKAYGSGGAANVWHFLLACWQMTRDPMYLKPYEEIAVDPGLRVCPLLRRLTGRDDALYRKEDRNVLLDAAGDPSAPRDFENPAYQAWLSTRDKRWLEAGFRRELYECVRTRFVYTEAYPPTDRIYASGREMLSLTALGGWGVDRDHFPWLDVSWEGLGTDVAALVLDGGAAGTKVLLYSFRDAPADAAARVWSLEPGEYEVVSGPDSNGDDLLDRPASVRRLSLRRASRIPLRIPPRQPWILEIRQIRKGPALLPRLDLAIAPRDVRFDPASGRLSVLVHNIGTAKASPFRVQLHDAAGRLLAERAS
ncbi:MAG: hypothetical protein AAB215_01740, partial [Planctomycetota bacterium]